MLEIIEELRKYISVVRSGEAKHTYNGANKIGISSLRELISLHFNQA